MFQSPGRDFNNTENQLDLPDVANYKNNQHYSQNNAPVNYSQFDPSSYPDDDDTSAFKNIRNTYYEDDGLPVPTRKLKIQKKNGKVLQKSYSLNTMYKNTHKSVETSNNEPCELTNRIASGMPRSPRRLPDMENSHWQTVDVPQVLSFRDTKRDSLSLHPEDSRSLQHQYEYDLIYTEQQERKKKKSKRKKWKSFMQKIPQAAGNQNSNIIHQGIQQDIYTYT